MNLKEFPNRVKINRFEVEMAQWLLFSLLLWVPFWGTYQSQETPQLGSPRPGQVLQSMVEITGSTGVSDFKSAELSFAYDVDLPDTWFWLADLPDPVSEGSLAGWDTTDLTDGNYRLRLSVTQIDGSIQVVDVRGLRVRNDTPVETDTAQPVETAAPAAVTREQGAQAAAAIPASQATARPVDDARPGIFGALRYVGYIVLAFVMVGLVALLRSYFHRK